MFGKFTMTLLNTLAVTLSLAALSHTTIAHHSTNGIYDEAADLELKGTVKEWRFVNPHPSLKLTVVDEKGESHEWDVSYGGSAVAHLKRRGYNQDTFKPGDQIIVKGKPALAKGVYGLLMEGGNPTKADGSPLNGISNAAPF
jgi:hypothetical protein